MSKHRRSRHHGQQHLSGKNIAKAYFKLSIPLVFSMVVTTLLKFCLRFILGTAVLLTVLLFASSSLLMNIFTTNRGIAADGAQMLRLQVIMTPCVGLILLLTIVFQSFGKSTGSFLLSISRQGVIFVASFSIIKDQLDDLLEYRRSVASGNKNEFSRDSFETSFANSLKTDYCYIEDEIARYSDR